MKSTLECILTDETASDIIHIFYSDRERTPYLNQTEKERHIIKSGFEPPPEQNEGHMESS